MAEPIDTHDARCRRCPMLGHEVPFSYCRSPGRELPCGRIFDCWWEAFDVASFLRAHLDEQEIQQILAPREAKVTSLVDLIRRAKEAAEKPPKP